MVPRSNSTRHTGGAARGAHLSGVKPCRPRGGGHGKDPGRDFAIFPNDPPAGGGLLRGNPHLIHKKETGNETSELRGLRCRPPAAGCAGLIKPASLPGGERNSHRQSLHGAAGNEDGATPPRLGAPVFRPPPGELASIAPRRGAKLPSPIPAWRSGQRGWRYATQTRSAGLQAPTGRTGQHRSPQGSETPVANPCMAQAATGMAQRHSRVPTAFRRPRLGLG